MVSTTWGAKSNVVDVMLVGGALMAALAFLHVRAKQARAIVPNQKLADARELELVKDIVYINNNVEPSNKGYRFVRQKCRSNDILVVGVCGGSGSGKTTLSRAIIEEFGADRVTYLSHDFYYKDLNHLTMDQRAEHNFDHPDSLETELLVDHVKQLRQGKTVNVPEYDFSTHSRCAHSVEMAPNSVILVEGILIFADQALADLMDIKIFVETAADIRLVRRMQRDMEERGRTAGSVMNQYMKTVRPMHMMFVESSKRVADIIIPHGVNSVALDMILSRLQGFAQRSSSSSASSEVDEETDPEEVVAMAMAAVEK